MIRRLSLFLTLCVWLFGVAGCATDSPECTAPDPRPLGSDLPAFNAPEDPSASAAEASLPQEPDDLLTLRQALALALMRNPELASFSWEVRMAEARALQAGLFPNPEVALTVERFAGTGASAGFDSAELSVELAQLIELGGKRLKRARVAQLERDLAAWDYEAKRIDVYTLTAQAYIELLAAEKRLELARSTLRLAERTYEVVTDRVRAGKVASVEEAKARVELTSDRVAHQRAEREVQVARRALAATWGSAEPRFARVSGDLTDVRPLPSFEDLVRRLAQNPDLARWTAEMALRRAAVTLEKAKAIPDIAISGGMTHFEEDNSRTGILGLLVPLPIFDRNQGGILEARYKLAKSDQDRRAIEVRVGLELYRTYQSLAQAHGEAATLHEQALPAAQRAFDAAQEGYKQGKWGYLEVLDSQRTLFGVRAQWIDALSSYHKALAESERLIGQSLDSVAAPAVALN